MRGSLIKLLHFTANVPKIASCGLPADKLGLREMRYEADHLLKILLCLSPVALLEIDHADFVIYERIMRAHLLCAAKVLLGELDIVGMGGLQMS